MLTCSAKNYVVPQLDFADMTQHAADPSNIMFAVGLKSVHSGCWARLQQLLHPQQFAAMQRPALTLRAQQ